MWLTGAVVCLLAAPRAQLSHIWLHNALWYNWLSQLVRDCKALLVTSLTHVSRAIASTRTFTFSPLI